MNSLITELRSEIDCLDRQIYLLLDKRIGVSRRIQELKLSAGFPSVDPEREKQILQMSPSNKAKLIMQTILEVCKIQ